VHLEFLLVFVAGNVSSLAYLLTRGTPTLNGAWGRHMFGAPLFEPVGLSGNKCTVLQEVLVTLLGLFGAPSDMVPGTLYPQTPLVTTLCLTHSNTKLSL